MVYTATCLINGYYGGGPLRVKVDFSIDYTATSNFKGFCTLFNGSAVSVAGYPSTEVVINSATATIGREDGSGPAPTTRNCGSITYGTVLELSSIQGANLADLISGFDVVVTSTSDIEQAVIDYFDNLPITTKLVIKGQSGNAEFSAVAEADFPRITLYDGSYIPLVEDDGEGGTTLKVRLNGKLYRLKTGISWEIQYNWGYTGSQMIVIDSSYNIAAFKEPYNSVFTSKFFKRDTVTADIYTAEQAYIGGGVGADTADGTNIGNVLMQANTLIPGTGTYERFIIAQKSQSDVLPFDEIGFYWRYASSLQAFLVRHNRTVKRWSSDGVFGDYFIFFYDGGSDYTERLQSRVLFKGKIRLVKMPITGTPVIEDLDASVPINRILSNIPTVAFALQDKSFTDYPFEAVFVDPYLANATMQGAIFDMFNNVKMPEKVPDIAETKFSGSYIDAIASHNGQFNTAITAKKDCTIIAINYAGENATTKVVSHTCEVGDTFNADMVSPYSRNYPWVYFAFQSTDNIPDEIAYRRHQSSSNVFGYFYNTRTNYADRESGTYLEQDYYGNTFKKVDFDGDLLIQPMYGAVQKLDGHDSWSQNKFSGFAMVFLATNSIITVNTTAGDEVIIVDESDNVVDTQTAGSDGKATLTAPTTKLGRSYTVQSLSTGASTSISATGNMSTELVVDPVKKLTIFRNGQFSNVIDGFDISQFQTVVDGIDTYEKIVPYLGSKWGINNKASNNSGDFTIDGNYIIKSQQSTYSVAGTYFIPVKKVSGFDKLRLTTKMKEVKNSNYIGLSAYTSNPSTPTTPFITVGGYETGPNYNDTDEAQIATILDATKNIDYVRVMGDIGTPAYNNIQLIKDSVHKSETTIDVIFDNGQFKSGVTTDFEFYPGKAVTNLTTALDINNTSLTTYFYSKYALSILMIDSNPYLIRDEYLKKPIYPNAASSYGLGNLYIPIKRAYGYTKCKVTMGLLTDIPNEAAYTACVPGYINDSRKMVNINDLTVQHNTNMIEYTISIANAPYVDYIILGGNKGEPAWTKIVLE